jgi:hypothetical protein
MPFSTISLAFFNLMNFSCNTIPQSWLAFELSVLKRIKFTSIALPFVGEPQLGIYLKHWGVRVAANDPMEWAFTKALAFIANNGEELSEEVAERILEDVYVPRGDLTNPALRKWFTEADAWWFDNFLANTEEIVNPTVRALALSFAMVVGDYALSFDEETRSLRRPHTLSDVFRRVWQAQTLPVNNAQRNVSVNCDARDFIAIQHTDALFLRLPRAQRHHQRHSLEAWREEWLRGSDEFWSDFETARSNRLGAPVETKGQYLRYVEDALEVAAHLPLWIIAHVEDGFVSSNELAEAIGRVRKVESVYTKDFSELIGARAAIITA